MKERPILFKGEMVRALLAGTKTQTRRAVRPQPSPSSDQAFVGLDGIWRFSHPTTRGPVSHEADDVRCPYGQPGDRLWVKETFWAYGRWEMRFSEEEGRDEWHFVDMTLECGLAYGFAEELRFAGMRRLAPKGGAAPTWWKRPSIFMPRVASRILLEVTAVRVERLQAISEVDALAEGVWTGSEEALAAGRRGVQLNHVGAYRNLWESINGAGSWEANPWVWVVEFKRVQPC